MPARSQDPNQGRLQLAILAVLAALAISVKLETVEQALITGNVAALFGALPMNQLRRRLLPPLLTEIRVSVTHGASLSGVDATVIQPAIAGWADRYAAQRVTQIAAETEAAVRGVVHEGIVKRLPARIVARQIRDGIGLTDRLAGALARRSAAINADPKLSDARKAQLIERYRRKLLQYRAETIARTEITQARTQGQMAAWTHAVAAGVIPASTRRRWAARHDERECPICDTLDGQIVGLGETFAARSGKTHLLVDGPPAHVGCRCHLALSLVA